MEISVELDRDTFRRLLQRALDERRSVGDQAELLLRERLQPPRRATKRRPGGRLPRRPARGESRRRGARGRGVGTVGARW
jgi:hypothetical protein